MCVCECVYVSECVCVCIFFFWYVCEVFAFEGQFYTFYIFIVKTAMCIELQQWPRKLNYRLKQTLLFECNTF